MKIREEVQIIPGARFPGFRRTFYVPKSVPSTGGTQGDFEGTIANATDETVYDITIDNPFAFTIVWAEFYSTAPGGTLNLQWGPQGAGSSNVVFDDGNPTVTDPVPVFPTVPTRHTCSQAVPVLGYVQINTVNSFPTGGDPFGDLHYKIHYTIADDGGEPTTQTAYDLFVIEQPSFRP